MSQRTINQTESKAASNRSSRPIAIGIAVGLALLTIAVYSQTFTNGYAFFDDDGYVVDNPAVRQGISGASLKFAWSTFYLGNWIPLTWMSYQLDAALWGIQWPIAFHTVDLGLHVANVLLVFGLMKTCTGATGRSALVAAFWAVHPLHVESVAWIAERKDVLSTFFLLVALMCYERYAFRLRLRWYAATIFAFLLGMLSKPMLVTFPVLLLLFDIWPLQRWQPSFQTRPVGNYEPQTRGRLLLEKLPLAVISAVFAAIMIFAQRAHGAVAATAVVSMTLRVANVVQSYGWYLFKTFVPTDLCAFYPLWSQPASWSRTIGTAVGLACVSFWVARNWRRRPWLACGWLWFLVSLLPVIGIVQLGTAAHADRYSYVPHLGLLAMLVWEVHDWLSRLPRGGRVEALLAGVLLMFCSALTFLQVGFWHDPQTLWRHALDLDSENWMAHMHLGRDGLRHNDAKAAIEHFQQTIQIHPGYTDAYLFLGALYQLRRQLDVAEQYYQAALKVDPQNLAALTNLGIICRETERPTAAREYLQRGLEIDPTATRPRDELKLLDADQ
jgi:cytochrome c-type biogenesis protein CcmH/NrfG